MATTQPEVWQRGPVAGVDPALMPSAHALLQTVEDVEEAVKELTPEEVWTSLGGAAPVGFHVMHLSGATDRLLTYARGELLNETQKSAIRAEREPPHVDMATLLAELRRTVDAALTQIRATPASSLQDARAIGRAALPTTVGGLIFHTAEHSQRHAGQIVTTAKILRGLRGSSTPA